MSSLIDKDEMYPTTISSPTSLSQSEFFSELPKLFKNMFGRRSRRRQGEEEGVERGVSSTKTSSNPEPET